MNYCPSCGHRLSNKIRNDSRAVTIQTIQKTVVSYFGLKAHDMTSQRREARIARARQIGMYLCRELLGYSASLIGQQFGGRDHTTVLHAFKVIDLLKATDKEIAADLRALSALIAEQERAA